MPLPAASSVDQLVPLSLLKRIYSSCSLVSSKQRRLSLIPVGNGGSLQYKTIKQGWKLNIEQNMKNYKRKNCEKRSVGLGILELGEGITY